jgi:hypothetical protein
MCPPESQTKTIPKPENKIKFEETCVVIEECDINKFCEPYDSEDKNS